MKDTPSIWGFCIRAGRMWQSRPLAPSHSRTLLLGLGQRCSWMQQQCLGGGGRAGQCDEVVLASVVAELSPSLISVCPEECICNK